MANIVLLTPLSTNPIPEDQVTRQRLSDVLDAIYCEHTIGDAGDIYVTHGVAFPLWIAVHHDLKLILMFTYIEHAADETVDWLDKINTLNASVILPQFSYYEGRVWGRYWLTYDGGERSPTGQDVAAFC
jgi:hypothetical protein